MNKVSKAERTKNFIIESTADIFNKKGYAATSLSDIMEATGLTKGSIYGNFENKEEVAFAVFDYNVSRLSVAIQEKVAIATTMQDKLMAYVEFYKSIAHSQINRGGCPILNTAIEADDTNNFLKERAAKAISRWEKSMTLLIQEGIDTGEFKSQINIPQTVLSIIALIEGGLMIAQVSNEPRNMDQVLKTAGTIISSLKKK